MKFSEKKDIVLSFNYNCIVTMGINQCGFHSNVYLQYSIKFLIYFNVT